MDTKGIRCVFLTFLFIELTIASGIEVPQQCDWLGESDDNNVTLHCDIDSFDEVEKLARNLNVVVTTLNFECKKWPVNKSPSEQKFNGSFRPIPKLEKVTIANCVIRNFVLKMQNFGSRINNERREQQSYKAKNVKVATKCPQTTTEMSTNDFHDFGKFRTFKRDCVESIEISNGKKFSSRPDEIRSLTSLHLTNNAISKIDDHAIDDLEHLRVFNFSSNRIVALPENLFSKTSGLNQIILSNNSLSILTPGLFNGLGELTFLDLSRNLLTSQWININTFSSLQMLVILDLSFNNLTIITTLMFLGLGNLQYLNLRRNQIDSLSELCFDTLHSLRTLNLSGNKIANFEAKHSIGLGSLIELRLDSNHLRSIPDDAFANFKNVQDLSLNENRFEHVPQGIQKLVHLQLLDLGDNKISDIGEHSFRGLNKLQGLRLFGNKLRSIPRKAFTDLSSVEVLNLGKNAIQKIDQDSFENNQRLVAIRVDENKMTNIRGIFDNLKSLVSLIISKNQLNTLDYDDIPRNLSSLDLSHNLIYNLRSSPKNHRLKILDMRSNFLGQISNASFPNTVERIFLDNNSIELISIGTFLGKKKLIEVHLSSNLIKYLDLPALELDTYPSNRSLPMFYLRNNPILCDCTMKWLPWMDMLSQLRHYPKVMDLDSIICNMVHTKGTATKPLLSLALEDFLCTYEAQCAPNCSCCHLDNCSCRMPCPKRCNCYHDYHWANNVVDCTNANYRVVPKNIPRDVTHLYLDGNALEVIENHSFSKLSKLKMLFLNKTKISTLYKDSFAGANQLKVINLENNNIRTLDENQFSQLRQLSELNLDHNSIYSIEPQTFKLLKKMSELRLENNMIVEFHPWDAVDNFATKIFLDGNFWNCDCENTLKLRDWLVNHTETVADKMFCDDDTETVFQAILRCERHSETIFLETKTFRFDMLFGALGILVLVCVVIILGMRANRRQARGTLVPCTEL